MYGDFSPSFGTNFPSIRDAHPFNNRAKAIKMTKYNFIKS